MELTEPRRQILSQLYHFAKEQPLVWRLPMHELQAKIDLHPEELAYELEVLNRAGLVELYLIGEGAPTAAITGVGVLTIEGRVRRERAPSPPPRDPKAPSPAWYFGATSAERASQEQAHEEAPRQASRRRRNLFRWLRSKRSFLIITLTFFFLLFIGATLSGGWAPLGQLIDSRVHGVNVRYAAVLSATCSMILAYLSYYHSRFNKMTINEMAEARATQHRPLLLPLPTKQEEPADTVFHIQCLLAPLDQDAKALGEVHFVLHNSGYGPATSLTVAGLRRLAGSPIPLGVSYRGNIIPNEHQAQLVLQFIGHEPGQMQGWYELSINYQNIAKNRSCQLSIILSLTEGPELHIEDYREEWSEIS